MRLAGIMLGRTAPPAPGDESKRPIRRGLLVVVALVLGLLAYEARYSPSLEWVIGLLGLGGLSAFAWRWVRRGTADPDALWGPTEADPIQAGDLEALSQSARRALRGLPFSQVVITSRARAAFLERVALSLGLSPEAIREAEADPIVLGRLVRDPVLAEFLHLPAKSIEEQSRWVRRARARGGFAREFRDVLARMEAWR